MMNFTVSLGFERALQIAALAYCCNNRHFLQINDLGLFGGLTDELEQEAFVCFRVAMIN